MKDTMDAILSDMQGSARGRANARLEDAQFLQSLAEDDKVPLPVACAFLLADMALIDGRFDRSEYEFIFNRLEGPLGLSKEDAARIVHQAKATLSTGRGAGTYAEYLAKNYTPEQRQQAFEMLKGMVLADGRQDDFELYLQNRLAQVLGVS